MEGGGNGPQIEWCTSEEARATRKNGCTIIQYKSIIIHSGRHRAKYTMEEGWGKVLVPQREMNCISERGHMRFGTNRGLFIPLSPGSKYTTGEGDLLSETNEGVRRERPSHN